MPAQDANQTEVQKLNVKQIRETLARLNNPSVPVETRQKALTSLAVELCDRVDELLRALAAGMKRQAEQTERLDTMVQQCSDAIATVIGRQPIDNGGSAAVGADYGGLNTGDPMDPRNMSQAEIEAFQNGGTAGAVDPALAAQFEEAEAALRAGAPAAPDLSAPAMPVAAPVQAALTTMPAQTSKNGQSGKASKSNGQSQAQGKPKVAQATAPVLTPVPAPQPEAPAPVAIPGDADPATVALMLNNVDNVPTFPNVKVLK